MNAGRCTFPEGRSFVRHPHGFTVLLIVGAIAATATAAAAQAPPSDPPDPAQAASRQAEIEQQQATKEQNLHPYVPNPGERIFDKLDVILAGGMLRWHPFFENAYSGGGFTLGLGHINYVSSYNYIDVRGSYSIASYKRIEAEFVAPRMFNRRAKLSILGGWREAPQVGFYGIGNDTSKDDRVNYLFRQPYASGLFTIYPNRKNLMFGGGLEYSRWTQESGEGSFPPIDTVYSPATLPGVGAEVTYLHTQGTVGGDWRTSPGYSRRGGYFGVTIHDYKDSDDEFGFYLMDYDGIGHIPILRETWVLSFHGNVQTAITKDDQQIPFFMLPSVGGGSSLRGYSSWRFRDENRILTQAEWRIMVNRYLDLAFFYDAGKVTARRSDLDLNHLRSDYGVGVRFHGPFATPLRIEIARSREATAIVFASGASF